MSDAESSMDRRVFLRRCAAGTAGVAVAATSGLGIVCGQAQPTVWQIDPHKCTYCGKCATECVLSESAVKCVHAFAMCGYCNLCFGYFRADAPSLDAGAENQMCPTGAIKRTFVEDPYYQYEIDEPLCIGCAKCAEGCNAWGNGSLYMQVRHDRCLNCNECAIAKACPANAFVRIPSSSPYLRKDLLAEDESQPIEP